MNKYLFTDGTNGVKELQTQEELETLVASAEHPERIRIWLFNSNEWISYAAFMKTPANRLPVLNNGQRATGHREPGTRGQQRGPGLHRLKKFLYIPFAAAGVFLVFNFTKIKWESTEPLDTSAIRPGNVPQVDIDSLIFEIESARGVPLDRSTRTNLRLRNDWPERIGLTLHAEKETSSAGSRYTKAMVTIDNTTGFKIDQAVVKFSVWKNDKVTSTDTLRFDTILFDKIKQRQLDEVYRGDSISVSFESIRAKAFNFCYSASTKNNSGNYNDRWFCRE